ncbi:MAG: energy transducer TonB [Ramlibacter sp.]
MRQSPRTLLIAAGVVLLHAAALWALQSGRVPRPAAVVVPVTLVSEQVTPPSPVIAPPPPAQQPKRPPPPARKPAPRKTEPARAPPPKALAAPTPLPAPVAPATAPEAPALPMAAAPSSEPAGPAGPPGPPGPPSSPARVELPSSNASYLQNPAPVYPAISKRLGEQGKVLVRVLIGADGIPQKAELKRGSGFDRLDRSALDYVMKCRYVPGNVGGVPQAMWYEAPVSFVLE